MKFNIKKLSLLVLTFLLTSVYVFAQDIIVTPKEKLGAVDEYNKIEVKKNEQKHPTKINFVCSSSGDICKSIDIEKENPFANLDYPIRNRTKNIFFF